MRSLLASAGVLCLLLHTATSVDIDFTTTTSIESGASTLAYGLVKFYTGNNTGDVAGNLPSPYYWWEAGAFFNTLIDYWAYTGDDSYNEIVKQAIVHQAGDNEDLMPANQTKSEGNDDQGFWAMTAMTAAEMNFTNPASDQPQYLALAQAVYNEYVTRWDTTMCNGGLRWQIYTFNNGYNYKNSISNGCFFNMASRLFRYTGNQTYGEWARKIFNWEEGVGFIDSNYMVYDGSGDLAGVNCTEINKAQFSYNAGIYLHGAAFMYNATNGTEQALWKTRVNGLVTGIQSYFFKNGVMWEPSCEGEKSCDTDQQSFKGHLARWMAMASRLAPFAESTITGLLKSSAEAAAKQCDGTSSDFKGPSGTACGFSWLDGASFDGIVGVGEQMNALAMVISTLAAQARTPYTAKTGGSSKGNVNAGSASSNNYTTVRAITTGDRVAAGFLTTVMLAGLCSGVYMVVSEWLD